MARTLEKLGRLASAFAEYRATAADAEAEGRTAVQTSATEAADALAPRVPLLTVKVTPSGAVVTLDGEPFAAGVAGPVNPGKHTLAASAPKLPTKKLEVTLAEGEKKTVSIVVK